MQFPIAAANGFGDVRNTPDRITPKLAALHVYQLALLAPAAPAGSFDPVPPPRGRPSSKGRRTAPAATFRRCSPSPAGTCTRRPRSGSTRSRPTGRRTRRYRTSPLKGLWTHQTGGFYHDGRFATLLDVVNHYDTFFGLGLSTARRATLVEYLKSL